MNEASKGKQNEERKREPVRDFKELAHSIVKAGKFQICRVGPQAETQGRVDVAASKSKGRLLAELSSSGKSVFFPLKAFN